MNVQAMYEKFPFPYDSDHGAFIQRFILPNISPMPSPKPKILDAGCGTGNMTIKLAQLFPDAEVFGCDFSSTSLSRAVELAEKSQVRNVFFKHTDLMLPLSNEVKFDLIISLGCIQHTPSPQKAIKNLRQVIRKDGQFLMAVYGQYGRMETELRRKLIQKMTGGDYLSSSAMTICKKVISERVLKENQIVFRTQQRNLHRIWGKVKIRLKRLLDRPLMNESKFNPLDIQFADQYLHPIVKIYPPEEWFRILKECHFEFVSFLPDLLHTGTSLPKDYMNEISDSEIRNIINDMNIEERFSVLDLIFRPTMYMLKFKPANQ